MLYTLVHCRDWKKLYSYSLQNSFKNILLLDGFYLDEILVTSKIY